MEHTQEMIRELQGEVSCVSLGLFFSATLAAPLAAALLLARQALSHMDVPTRQAYTMALISPAERTAAASVQSRLKVLKEVLWIHQQSFHAYNSPLR